MRTPVTLQSSTRRAPPLRAPLAKAMVVSAGLVEPSSGKWMAPMRSAVFMSGHSSCTRLGVTGSAGTPKARAMEAPRRSSSQRSSLVAMERLPFCL